MFRSADKPLLYITFLLLGGGLLILASSSMMLSQKNFGSPSYYLWHQLLLGGIPGVIALIVTAQIPYHTWRKFALPLMAVSFLLLALLFIPQLSYSFGGARRWLKLGPISIQPSEILKLGFITYLASWIDSRRQEVGSVSRGLIPFTLMLAIVGIFLIMQPDIGTLGIIVATAGLLYFLGGGKVNQIATIFILGLAILYFIIQAAPYRQDRIKTFLNPRLEPQGKSYQINQAFIALGSGGFLGSGFGRSLQKYNYLPEPMGDSIFAIFGEEVGFAGVTLLIAAFGFLFWRILYVARRAPDLFGKLLASGIGIGIVVQAFINMAAISGLMPLTGIPLPFISYGGTALIMTLASIGIVLNISKHI